VVAVWRDRLASTLAPPEDLPAGFLAIKSRTLGIGISE